MHFSTIIVLALVGCAAARPQFFEPIHAPTPLLARQEIRDDAGQYSLAYTSADGQSQSSYGVLKPNPDGRGHFLSVTGSYSYTSPDGTPIYVTYIADENGFRIVPNPTPSALAPTLPVGPLPLA